jgi:hypothetical protein
VKIPNSHYLLDVGFGSFLLLRKGKLKKEGGRIEAENTGLTLFNFGPYFINF